MTLAFSLVAKLHARQIRNDPLGRRIDSLSGTAGPGPAPAVSVFRRGETAARQTDVAANSGRLRRKIVAAVNAPTARMWAPANGNAAARPDLRVS